MLITPASVVAQEGAFDVKAVSGADGNAAGEFPLSYTIVYDDGTEQDIHVNEEGVTQYTAPNASATPVSIRFLGVSYVVQSNVQFCLPRNPANGGCWCLCLQWVRVWPWWVVPRWFWYWNPCC